LDEGQLKPALLFKVGRVRKEERWGVEEVINKGDSTNTSKLVDEETGHQVFPPFLALHNSKC
jgi:hypothetical protein